MSNESTVPCQCKKSYQVVEKGVGLAINSDCCEHSEGTPIGRLLDLDPKDESRLKALVNAANAIPEPSKSAEFIESISDLMELAEKDPELSESQKNAILVLSQRIAGIYQGTYSEEPASA